MLLGDLQDRITKVLRLNGVVGVGKDLPLFLAFHQGNLRRKIAKKILAENLPNLLSPGEMDCAGLNQKGKDESQCGSQDRSGHEVQDQDGPNRTPVGTGRIHHHQNVAAGGGEGHGMRQALSPLWMGKHLQNLGAFSLLSVKVGLRVP